MFDIEQYIDKLTFISETNCNLIYQCPLCHSDKLKISKSNGYWKCWSCEDTKGIRDYLNPPKLTFGAESVSNVFVSRSNIKLKPLPIERPSKISYCYVDSNFIHSIDPDCYYYSDCQKVVRVAQSGGAQSEIKKKIFFSSRLDCESEWEWRKGLKPWSLYRINEVDLTDSNAILMAEGEKVADDIHSRGIFCSTAPGFAWNEDWLRSSLKLLRGLGLAHIAYVGDSDKVGRKKANLLKDCAEFERISCEVFYPAKEGEDFYDLSEEEKDEFLDSFWEF